MLIGRFEEQGLSVSIELTELSLKVVTEAQKHFLLLTVGCIAFRVIFIGNWSWTVSDIECSCAVDGIKLIMLKSNYLIISMDGTLTLIWSSSLCSSSIMQYIRYRGNRYYVRFVSHMTHKGWVELIIILLCRLQCTYVLGSRKQERWRTISSTLHQQRLQDKA